MTRDDFVRELYDHDTYTTPPGRVRPFPARHPLWASTKFHLRNLCSIIRTVRLVKREGFYYPKWPDASFEVVNTLEASGGRMEVSGFSNLVQAEQPTVYVCNHMSLLETFLLPIFLLEFSYVSFVVKESLIRYPVFGHITRASDPIAVSRENARQDLKQVLQRGEEKLQQGRSVAIFPQATRSVSFSHSAFNTLGAKLAEKNDTAVVPVAVRTDFLREGRIFKDFGMVDPSKPVCFSFGPAFKGDAKQMHGHVVDFITSQLREWDIPVRD